ncbi:MAG: sulfatase [Chthoniobacteraceae bacterium]|nr:sulfatase [Chthoniobacteraceae bacterium]
MKTVPRFLVFTCGVTSLAYADPAKPPGMVWIPGGQFSMGTDEKDAYPVERPAHQVKVDGFWMDETEVTNAQFAKFIEATKYVTVAERVPDWEELKKQLPPGTEKPSPQKLVAGSLVFTPLKVRPPRDDVALWWKWMPDTNWRSPEGPASNIAGREQYPVVQVSYEDAVAYAKWAGKRLPSEAEWEFAARGGFEAKRYAWGDEFRPGGKIMANVWQGQFPNENTKEDGFEGAAPVKTFPPNGYGLYDMIGNVWEWCADWFDTTEHSKLASEGLCHNPVGPARSFNPHEPYTQQRVIKGGSFLCAEHYCVNYRPSSRRGTDYDTGMSHLGFRCVFSSEQKSKNNPH